MSDHVTHLNDDEIENVGLDSSKSATQQNRKVSSQILSIQYYDVSLKFNTIMFLFIIYCRLLTNRHSFSSVISNHIKNLT